MGGEGGEAYRTKWAGATCGSGTIVDRKPRRGRQLGCDLNIGRERRRQPTPTPNPHGKQQKEETEGGDGRTRDEWKNIGRRRCRGRGARSEPEVASGVLVEEGVEEGAAVQVGGAWE